VPAPKNFKSFASISRFDRLLQYLNILNFKEQILGFIMEIFNPAKVRFTTVEELTEDIKKLLVERVELLKVKLSNELLPV
jgi:hypothetical protein